MTHDTPDVLADYAVQRGLPDPATAKVPWRFLTSDDPTATKIIVSTGFKLYYEDAEESGKIDFVPQVVIIDGWGIVRSNYRQFGLDSIQPAILTRDFNLIITEIKNSTGPASLVYEAAHLFSCYP